MSETKPDLIKTLQSGIVRRGTDCEKWDTCEEGVMAMWVADMDFPIADGIQAAIEQRVAHHAWGYPMHRPEDDDSLIAYYLRNHGLSLSHEEIFHTRGVVDSLQLAVHALTAPGEKVVIQTPVYGPFFRVIRATGRQIVENPLIETESGRWEMDLQDLDKQLCGAKLLLLCSPHNPTGRLWEKETLQKVVDLCKKHEVYLVADEIHCDFALDGKKHVPILSLSGTETGVAQCVSATKSFNIAGLAQSAVLCRDREMKAKMVEKMGELGLNEGNVMALIATKAAYATGDCWLQAVKSIIRTNRDLAIPKLREAGIKVYPNEGIYLMFLDFRAFGLSSDEMCDFLIKNAKVRLNSGSDYGPRAEGFMRLNLAAPTDWVLKGISRICNAVKMLERKA